MKRFLISTLILLAAAPLAAQHPFAFDCRAAGDTPLENQLCALVTLAAMEHPGTREPVVDDLYFFGLVVIAAEAEGGGGLAYGVAVDAYFDELNGVALSAFLSVGHIRADQVEEAAPTLAIVAVNDAQKWLTWAVKRIKPLFDVKISLSISLPIKSTITEWLLITTGSK